MAVTYFTRFVCRHISINVDLFRRISFGYKFWIFSIPFRMPDSVRGWIMILSQPCWPQVLVCTCVHCRLTSFCLLLGYYVLLCKSYCLSSTPNCLYNTVVVLSECVGINFVTMFIAFCISVTINELLELLHG